MLWGKLKMGSWRDKSEDRETAPSPPPAPPPAAIEKSGRWANNAPPWHSGSGTGTSGIKFFHDLTMINHKVNHKVNHRIMPLGFSYASKTLQACVSNQYKAPCKISDYRAQRFLSFRGGALLGLWLDLWLDLWLIDLSGARIKLTIKLTINQG